VSIFHLHDIKRKTTETHVYIAILTVHTLLQLEEKPSHKRKDQLTTIILFAMPSLSGTYGKYEKGGAWRKVEDHYAREMAGALLRDMAHSTRQSSLPVKVKRQVKAAKKTKAKSVRRRIQKLNKTQNQHQHGQLLVEYDTVSHLDHCSTAQHTPTQQCGVQHEPLVEGGGNAGVMVWPSDSSSASTSSYSGEQDSLLGFDHEDWLEDEDVDFDLFGLLQYY
jgi:hypothetical protein